MDLVNIRAAASADIPRMLHLERRCSSAAHWAEQQYQQLFQAEDGRPRRLVLVAGAWLPPQSSEPGAEPDSRVLGFLIARHIVPEWELENVVVAPTARRKGLGRQLVNLLLDRARETNSDSVFLEVRESNVAARTLYENVGFELSGRRKAYYTDPMEDALLYRWQLP